MREDTEEKTVSDGIKLRVHSIVEDFLGDHKQRPKDLTPVRVQEFQGNLPLNEGLNALLTLLCGGAETPFDNANAYIGIGDSDAAAEATQTGLQGSNKAYKGMDSGFPTYGTDQKTVFRSTFGQEEGNHAWKEFTIANGDSDAAKNLNRKVQDMGTKTNVISRVMTVEITATAA
jgi:hypothetical protein